jgi:hypothetical protein
MLYNNYIQKGQTMTEQNTTPETMSDEWLLTAIKSVKRIGTVPGSVEYINALKLAHSRKLVVHIGASRFAVTELGEEWVYRYEEATAYDNALESAGVS